MPPTTGDQKFYRDGKRLKAEIDVCLTHETEDAPSIAECRHAVLQLKNKGEGYVIYDRLLNRIVNGVYYMPLEQALLCAQDYNDNPDAWQDMAPNGAALGLKYPKKKRS